MGSGERVDPLVGPVDERVDSDPLVGPVAKGRGGTSMSPLASRTSHEGLLVASGSASNGGCGCRLELVLQVLTPPVKLTSTLFSF